MIKGHPITFPDTTSELRNTIGDSEYRLLHEASRTLFEGVISTNDIRPSEPMIANLSDPDANFLVAMHDHAIEWLVEDVGDTRADIGEQSHGVANEIRRAKDAVQLSQDLLPVVIHDTFFQIWQR